MGSARTSNSAGDNSYIRIFGKPVHRAWIILVGCCSLAAGSLGTILGCQGVFTVSICEELGLTRAEATSWQQMYFIFSIVALPIAAKLFDKVDVRILVAVNAACIAIAAAAMGTYTQAWQFKISGAIFGICGSCIFFLPTSTMISNWFAKRAGIAMGATQATGSIAIVILAPLLTQSIATIGWRATYFLQGGIAAALIIPFALLVFRLRPADIGALPYGYEGELPEDAAMLVDRPVPGVPARRALKSLAFIALFLFAGIVSIIAAGFDPHMPAFVQSIGFDPMFAAFTVSALQLGSFIEKIIMGWVNDKIGVHNTVYIEFVLVATGMLGLAFARQPQLIIVFAFLFGIQDSFNSVSIPLLIRTYFGNRDYTTIYAWSRIGSSVFGSFSSVLIGSCYDVTGSYVPAFLIAVGGCVVGAVLVTIARFAAKRLVWEDASNSDGADGGDNGGTRSKFTLAALGD